MTRSLSIALLALRAAIRSRLVVSLAVLLLVVIVGLGASIKGDGTVEGQVRVLLYYTLGLSALLLGAATLWTSCGGIAEEIKDKHIQLLAVKPVHRFQIWLGKWIALVLLNAVLLALTGITFYAVLQHKIRSPRDRSLLREDILTARRVIAPRREAMDDEVRRHADLLMKEQRLSPSASRREVYAFAEKQVMAERCAIPPGGSKQWVLDIPASLRPVTGDPGATCSLRVRLYSANRQTTTARGTWAVGWEQTPTAFTNAMQSHREGLYHFSVPFAALRPGQAAVVRFTNAGTGQSNTVVLDPEQSIELLVKEGSFEMNLVRALVVLLCHLALVAALGLTASTVFSFPVATFMAVAVLMMSLLGHYFTVTSVSTVVPHELVAESSLYYVMVERIIEHLDMIIGPAVRIDPLTPLSDGVLVSWGFTGQAVLILSVLYPAVLFLIGAYTLKRRELALPE